MDKYLTVFSSKGWQVIDRTDGWVLETGSKDKMLVLADTINLHNEEMIDLTDIT